MAIGDHIKVARWARCYYHHGVDMGDGTVVHFSGEPLRPKCAHVIRSTMEEFLLGGTLHVVSYSGTVRDAEEVVATAASLIGGEDYCMFKNNCEHFARFCKTGRPTSFQIRRLALLAGATTTSIVWAGVAVARGIQRGRRLRPRGHMESNT